MNPYRLIIPLGIAGYTVFFFALLTGLRIIHFAPKLHFKVHKYLGIIGFIIVTIHTAIVIYVRWG